MKAIIDALDIYKGRDMRFVIYPAFADQEQVNTQKLVVSGVVKEIVEADGGWGKSAQVVFEGGSTFLFQNYQTEWAIGEMAQYHGSLTGFHKDPEPSRHKVVVQIGAAW